MIDVSVSQSGKHPNTTKKATLTGTAKFRAASLNVGTLNKRSAELEETLARRRVDICGLQEIRRKAH